MKYVITMAVLAGAILACTSQPSTEKDDWQLGLFIKDDAANPVLTPRASSVFYCPVRKDSVRWEEKDVFNPSTVVRNDTLFLLYRAEDVVGKHAGTSRLGLAYSTDGLHFTRLPLPVFYPDEDFMKSYEWEGGVEDPRLVEDAEGNYILTYTSYDGDKARLCVATSPNLVHWQKHGLAFGDSLRDLWSKSGSIVTEQQGSRFVAKKINGRYFMYWGDTNIYGAESDDLIHWTPVQDDAGNLVPVFGPREKYFDSDLVEPGPHAWITADGILLLYNSRNKKEKGDPSLPDGNYAAAQILFDKENPAKVIARSESYFLTPDKPYEILGQVNNVCFIEGLAFYKNAWFLYYGTADSKIAVAVAR